MTTLNYLNNVINNRSAFVPESLCAAIIAAANAQGVTICTGIYNPETQSRALYVA